MTAISIFFIGLAILVSAKVFYAVNKIREGSEMSGTDMSRSTRSESLENTAYPGSAPVKNIEYKKISGADSSLLSLDVYPVKGAKDAPVVIFIHGGTWTSGDKGNIQRNKSLSEFFQRNGAVLVSANMRLVGSGLSPGTTYSDQAADVASAIRWTYDHIAEYGGDPKKIATLGFSSGAHLVALVGTDEKYLKEEGLDFSVLDGVVSFDVDAYDIPRAIIEGKDYHYPAAEKNLSKIFTSDSSVQRDASPIYHISSEKTYPAFLIVYAGTNGQTLSKRQSEVFADALKKANVHATAYGDLSWTHDQLVMQFGRSDFALTDKVQKFFDEFLWSR